MTKSTEQRVATLRRLHHAANETVAAWAGTETATAAAMVATGARRRLTLVALEQKEEGV